MEELVAEVDDDKATVRRAAVVVITVRRRALEHEPEDVGWSQLRGSQRELWLIHVYGI